MNDEAIREQLLDARARSIARASAAQMEAEQRATDVEAVALCDRQLAARLEATHAAWVRDVVSAPAERTRALLLSVPERDEARAVVVRYCRLLLREQGAAPEPIDGAEGLFKEVDLASFDALRALLDTHAARKKYRAEAKSYLVGIALFCTIAGVAVGLVSCFK
jgi:hypothetical protein